MRRSENTGIEKIVGFMIFFPAPSLAGLPCPEDLRPAGRYEAGPIARHHRKLTSTSSKLQHVRCQPSSRSAYCAYERIHSMIGSRPTRKSSQVGSILLSGAISE